MWWIIVLSYFAIGFVLCGIIMAYLDYVPKIDERERGEWASVMPLMVVFWSPLFVVFCVYKLSQFFLEGKNEHT